MRKITFLNSITLLLLGGLSVISPTLGLKFSKSIVSRGMVVMKEVLIEWSISTLHGITDPDYAVNVSRSVGASAVLLLIDVTELNDISTRLKYIKEYKEAGFSVYVSVSAKRLLTLNDINGLLSLDIEGIGVNIFGEYNQTKAELSLIELAEATSMVGKKFAYYHGDGLYNVNATKMSEKGIIVWAWWTGEWKPKTWDLTVIWAQMCIWKNRSERPDTTYDDIINWYASLPKKPQAILWWQTTDQHQPKEEQILGMREVSLMFLG